MSTDTQPLGTFEGLDVLTQSMEVTNAGDGLSKGLAIEPQELHHGDEVVIVLRGTIAKVRFDPIKDTDALRRVVVFRSEEGMLNTTASVATALDKQRAKLAKAKADADQVEGQTAIDVPGEDDEPPYA